MSSVEFVSPNQYSLSGGGMHIRYSNLALVGPAGGPHLIYQDSQRALTFSGKDLHTVSVDELGDVVSVLLFNTIDTGSTTLSVLLPAVNIVSQGPVSSVPVTTEAIVTTHSGPFSPPLSPPFGHGQRAFYTVTRLDGTASHDLVA
jgi:hypothetical protein